MLRKRIYLDFAAITPIDGRVQKVMQKASRFFANPSSLYKEGVEAKIKLEEARKDIAGLISALPDEIFFTSGGTEGNNLAILGAYIKAREFLNAQNKKPHLIVSSIEHSSVLEVAKHLEKRGVLVTYIEPDEEGIIDPKKIREALKPETFLVSVHLANNEIGV
ncbi:MAG TPA: aminotransferase class V-fold PLP-dependent enzyme, partial [Candidatus Paceibacterota bacterium]|nr:aminotransferase class V-fold PLP-dependent enzyme [Candidatus Paceibacterota bacterium]